MNSDTRALWVGDIEPWMTETYLTNVFDKVGKKPAIFARNSRRTPCLLTRFARSRWREGNEREVDQEQGDATTSRWVVNHVCTRSLLTHFLLPLPLSSLGYCFIEFESHEIAQKILMTFNSQPIPGAQSAFRMNWGKMRKAIHLFLLPPSDSLLLSEQCRYCPSCIRNGSSASIIAVTTTASRSHSRSDISSINGRHASLISEHGPASNAGNLIAVLQRLPI